MSHQKRLVLALLLAAASGCLAARSCAQWSAPIQVSSAPKIFTFWQSWAFDAQGSIHMVYRNWDDGTPQIYYCTNRSGAWVQTYLNDGKNNLLAITPDQVLHFFYVGTNDHIYERTKPVAGGAWSGSSQVDIFPQKGFLQDTAVDESGGLYLAYGHLFDSSLNPPSAAYGRYRPAGGDWGPTEFIQGISNDIWPQNMNLAVRGTDILAAYRLTNTSHGARLKVRQSGVWGPETVVSPNHAYGGTIAVSPTGELAMAYSFPADSPESGTHWQIWVCFSQDGGATWNEPFLVHGQPDLHRSPFCTYDAKGNFHIAWEGRTSESGKFRTWYRARIGGLWQPEEIVADPGSANQHGLKVFGRTLWCTYNAEAANKTNQVFLKQKPLSTDDTPPAPVSGLTATPGERSLRLSWQNPPDGDFAGTRIVMGAAGYPTGPFTSTVLATRAAAPGSHDSYTVYPLSSGQAYYFSVFAQDSSGNWSTAATASETPLPDTHPPADPTSFTAEPYTSGKLMLSWRNPPNADFAGTMVRVSTSGYPAHIGDGGLVCNRQSAPGSADSFVHERLTPGVTYYYAAFAYDQQPAYSTGARASGVPRSMTCREVKLLPDGAPVDLLRKVVTGVFRDDGAFYVSEPDRSSGIRVLSGASVSPGDVVDVSGLAGTRILSLQPSERQVAASDVRVRGTADVPAALAVRGLSVGGAPDSGFAPGVTDGTGLNNMGLLVRCSGKVTSILGTSVFVDDGSGVRDPSGRAGVLVRCPAGVPPVSVGDFVAATGIVEGSIPAGQTSNRRLIRLRDSADLVVLTAGQAP